MGDLVFIVLIVAFLAASFGLVKACQTWMGE